MKKALVHQCVYADADVEEARASLFENIEVFFNRVRRHSALGGLSPEQYEQDG
ncbi:MAG: IS3 family transposase [Fuerstiella sp.]|nr:IS3 family transposase [Fuerstiella sp.]MDG2128726.1 IS3 family transposase [Fuerstiella sp.]